MNRKLATALLSVGSACFVSACSGSDASTQVGTSPTPYGGQSATAIGGSSYVSVPATAPSSGGAAGSFALGGSAAMGGSLVGLGGAAAGGQSSSSSTSSGSGGLATTGGSAASGGKSNGVLGGSSSRGGGMSGGTSAKGGAASGGMSNGGSPAGGSPAGGSPAGGSPAGGSPAGGASGSGNLAPASGALLGMFTPAQSEGELAGVESQVGRKFAIHLGYFDWGLDYTEFARADISAGRIPYVTVEPFNVSLDSIVSGTQDSLMRQRATSIKGPGGKVLLRFAHEMNGNWYAWDGSHNGANTAAAQKYVAAYRRLHDTFRDAGVTNVLWVFCPNVDSVPNESWNQWSNYYPGDNYVDWMCYDGYNWGTDTFSSMTSRIYSGLAAKGKPIMLGETSTKDAEKSAWISAILPAMKSSYPLLKALVWFHVNKENDWRFNSTSSSQTAFITMAKDPYFNPK